MEINNDFTRVGLYEEITSYLPLKALLDCNRIVMSLLEGGDGNIEKSPFMSPLVWAALLFLSDWKKEKKAIQKMMLSPMDCNYTGLCGFNLFHFYLVQSLITDEGFEKLVWWTDKPMVDCNASTLSLHDRPDIVLLHPAQLVSRIAPKIKDKKRIDKVLSYLVSRGMSCHYLDLGWTHLETTPNKHLSERIEKQQGRRQGRSSGHFLPTPQMNDLKSIPYNQHLCYKSGTGLAFRFHGSFMDTIMKTHKFPFTMETIPQSTIQGWLSIFEKKWVPREEFVSTTPFLCHDVFMGGDKLFIHLLNSWIYPIYPYSRIIMLSTFPLTEKMYEYMCMKLKTNVFQLPPFHETRTTCWKNFFLWACYDCIHEFFFANQMEEIVSQLEIFYSLRTSFLEEYPNVETFILLNNHEMSAYKIYSHEFDYTMCQVYHIFKKMSIFVRR